MILITGGAGYIGSHSIILERCPRRDGDPKSLIADNSKAKEILNWTPKKSLENSVQTAYNWETKLKRS